MDYLEVTEQVRLYAKANLKKSRYEHSVRVAQMCARLCRYFGFDDQRGYFAGMAHDICKELADLDMISTAQRDGNSISEFEATKPGLLHGRAAAVVLKEQFNIEDEEVLEAVAFHTGGKIGMCDLTKCLFVADKIEVGRPQVNEKYLEDMFKLSLNEMVYTVLKESNDYLKASVQGFIPFPETQELMDFYKS